MNYKYIGSSDRVREALLDDFIRNFSRRSEFDSKYASTAIPVELVANEIRAELVAKAIEILTTDDTGATRASRLGKLECVKALRAMFPQMSLASANTLVEGSLARLGPEAGPITRLTSAQHLELGDSFYALVLPMGVRPDERWVRRFQVSLTAVDWVQGESLVDDVIHNVSLTRSNGSVRESTFADPHCVMAFEDEESARGMQMKLADIWDVAGVLGWALGLVAGETFYKWADLPDSLVADLKARLGDRLS